MRTRTTTTLFALIIALVGCATTVHQAESASIPPVSPPRDLEPRIELWTTGGDVVRRGDDVGVRFRTSSDGFVVVGRIDTDGRVDILYPRRPNDDARAWGGETHEVDRYSGRAFTVDDRPGIGYVFAIVSPRRLRLARYANDNDWDYHGLPNVEGDPFVAMHHFAEQVVDGYDDDYSMDYAEYHVDGRYEYPRFVCYDCHHGRPAWDVYSHPCVRFHIVIYDEPEYYPYRRGGRRVVYSRPRYEFKTVSNEHPAGKVEYGRRGSGDVVDRRRPGAPTEDPNVPHDDRRGGNNGATRPGDDVGVGRQDPRDDRRGGGNNDGGPANGGSHRDRPVRDTVHAGGGDDHGNGGDNHENGGGSQGNGNAYGHRRPPVTGDGGGNGNNGNGNNGNGNGGDGTGNGNNGNGNGANHAGNGDNGNGRPRSEPRADPRSEPRSEPRTQPRAEPRSEPRPQPRSEPRAEPRTEPRPEPRSEPRQAPERRSEPPKPSPTSQPVERKRRP